MVTALVNLIIWLLVIGILYALVEYVLSVVPLPGPMAQIVRVVVVVLMALAVIVLLLGLVGVEGGVHLPKITP